MTFLDRLRALDARATPGPLSTPHLTDHAAGDCRCGYLFAWEGGEYCVATVHKSTDAEDWASGEYPPEEQAAANGGLLVLLRNSAPRLAALVEAAQAVIDYANRLELDPEDRAIVDPLRAALTALDTEPT